MNVKIKLPGIDAILKDLKIGKLPTVRVGILGDHAARKDGQSNADIGVRHEFGDPAHGLPQRSFLRMPLTDHFKDYLDRSKLFDEHTVKEVFKHKTITPWMKKIGIVAEQTILEAFQSGGFGKWAPWKGNYQSRTGKILVDSQQLEQSITSQVVR